MASEHSAWQAAPRVASSSAVRPSASTIPTMAPEAAMAALAGALVAPSAPNASIAGPLASSTSLCGRIGTETRSEEGSQGSM